jgi:hypothetical protein
MKTMWLLLWCVDSCLNGVYTEGPREWAKQATDEGRPFCAEGGCNDARTCDIARIDILDKGQKTKRYVFAVCAPPPGLEAITR